MNARLLLVTPGNIEVGISTGYFLGALIALLILGYLIYSLVRPDKF